MKELKQQEENQKRIFATFDMAGGKNLQTSNLPFLTSNQAVNTALHRASYQDYN